MEQRAARGMTIARPGRGLAAGWAWLLVAPSLLACETKTPVDGVGRDESTTVTASETGDAPEPVATAPQTSTAEPTGGTADTARPDPSAPPTSTPSGGTAVKGTDEPIPDPITHPCVVKTAQLEIALAAASGKCTTKADCDCYPGGYSRKGGCGGVTDAATAKKLHAIAAELASMSCPKNLHCGPRPCAPTCVDGRCK